MYVIGLITSSIKYYCRKQEVSEFLCCQGMFTCLKWRTSSFLCSVLQEIANHFNIIIEYMCLKVYSNPPVQCKNPLAHQEQEAIQSQFGNSNKRESTSVIDRLFHCLTVLKNQESLSNTQPEFAFLYFHAVDSCPLLSFSTLPINSFDIIILNEDVVHTPINE